MTDLGVKEKDAYPKPENPHSGNEKRYPTIDVYGKQAELMGAPDLNEGDCVVCEVKLRVKRHVKTEEDGKTSYSMCLCIEEMGDMESCEDEEKESEDESEDEGTSNLRMTLDLDEE